MTTREGVTKKVIEIAQKLVKPGNPINKTAIRAAYNMARAQAIREIVAWKKQYITIEETL